MRIICHSCGATFELADDRIRGRKLRIRCRSCDAIFEATWSGREPVRRDESDESDAACSNAQSPEPRRRRPPPPPRPTVDDEWYLAVGDSALGPLSFEELSSRFQRRELTGDHFVWSPSLGQWYPAACVTALQPALEATPPALRTGPPPPPPALSTAPRYALTPMTPPPGATAPPPPVAGSTGQARPVAQWPTALVAAGGAALLTAAIVLLATGRFGATGDAPHPPGQQTVRAHGIPHRTTTPPYTIALRSPEGSTPPLEIHVPRASSPPPIETAAADASTTVPDDLRTQLAARVLRLNRASLAACDTLAERRGERLQGTRAGFSVQIDDTGEGTVSITGRGVSEARLTCYRSVASQWQFPRTNRTISTTFWHVH